MSDFIITGISRTSFADPSGANALVAAISWVQATFVGTVSTIIAIIAVASIGLMALMGRVSIRHGMRVVTGCFILFGAPTIAAGILAAAGRPQLEARLTVEPSATAELPPEPTKVMPQRYDPYAGASLPARQ